MNRTAPSTSATAPATKAAAGDHDENVAFEVMVEALGAELAEQVRDVTLAIFAEAVAYGLEGEEAVEVARLTGSMMVVSGREGVSG